MKRQRLGQHYLVDRKVVDEILTFASIRRPERVLEIGTGRGVLTTELAGLGSSFVGYEIDKKNYEATAMAVKGSQAKLVRGDAFAHEPEFDVLVTSLPYSESAAFIRWLCTRRFSRAVAVLQKDFLEKIMSPPGDRDYRGISALAQIAFEVKALAEVRRAAFEPPPRVDSAIASFVPKRTLTKAEAARVIRLFSLRRRQADATIAELGFAKGKSYGKRRVFWLAPDEVYEVCRLEGRE